MGGAGFMAFVHADADVRAAGHAASERLERWAVDLPFDPAVAAAVTELAATPEAAALTGERARLLEFTVRDIRNAGHELSPEAREEVRAAMARLVEIGVRFNAAHRRGQRRHARRPRTTSRACPTSTAPAWPVRTTAGTASRWRTRTSCRSSRTPAAVIVATSSTGCSTTGRPTPTASC